MSQPQHVPTTHAIYYSAHRGLVWGSDGAFHHFARQCDPIHTRNGYWKFSTYEDDQRAYAWGFRAPEDVLIAQDVGDGAYNDIILRWVPGTLDEGNKPTVGTAAQHLETIYNERRILGKSLSFRGRVPLYPIGTDQRLINHRLMRYGAQKSVLPGTVPIPPAQRSLSTVSQHVPSALTANTKRVSNPDPSTVSLQVRLCRSETQPALVTQNLDKQSLKAVALILDDNELNNGHTIQTDLLKNSNLGTNCQPGEQVPYHSQTLHANHAAGCVPLNAIQARSQPTSPRMPSLLTSPKLSVEMPRGLEERAYTDDEVVCCTSYDDDDDVLDTAADNTFVLSTANLSPTQVFDAQSASLPCFDCGVVGAHAPHCCIAGRVLRVGLRSSLIYKDRSHTKSHVHRETDCRRVSHTRRECPTLRPWALDHACRPSERGYAG